ncbi:MAG: hypothetical protein ACXQT4_07260 [Methanotrichaceae archaeon]
MLRERHLEIGTGRNPGCAAGSDVRMGSNRVLADMAIERNCMTVAVDEGSDRYIYNK